MANHSWSNGDMNHQRDALGIAMNWSSEEQAILEDALVRYSSEPSPSISRYAKIASELQHKSVRDVAMRCRWTNLTENLTLFCKTRQNIKNLLKNLQENAPEPMKRMPWPEKLSVDHDELLDSILDLSASPKQQPSPEEFDHDQLLGSLFRPSTSPKQP
ncbi:unnamed protein product [Brassica oleracea var. botrytis]|uniref:(rape) hypothetical protein n=1 Tax=Brassica napus TaxID=3708 RepID=A0A078FXN2_BRANA|nr:unnamed protein product [Brassica napus]CDY17924.1 BnaC04g02950D [Brassica napus]